MLPLEVLRGTAGQVGLLGYGCDIGAIFVVWIILMLGTDSFPLLPVSTTLPQFTWFANVCGVIFFTFL